MRILYNFLHIDLQKQVDNIVNAIEKKKTYIQMQLFVNHYNQVMHVIKNDLPQYWFCTIEALYCKKNQIVNNLRFQYEQENNIQLFDSWIDTFNVDKDCSTLQFQDFIFDKLKIQYEKQIIPNMMRLYQQKYGSCATIARLIKFILDKNEIPSLIVYHTDGTHCLNQVILQNKFIIFDYFYSVNKKVLSYQKEAEFDITIEDTKVYTDICNQLSVSSNISTLQGIITCIQYFIKGLKTQNIIYQNFSFEILSILFNKDIQFIERSIIDKFIGICKLTIEIQQENEIINILTIIQYI